MQVPNIMDVHENYHCWKHSFLLIPIFQKSISQFPSFTCFHIKFEKSFDGLVSPRQINFSMKEYGDKNSIKTTKFEALSFKTLLSF